MALLMYFVFVVKSSCPLPAPADMGVSPNRGNPVAGSFAALLVALFLSSGEADSALAYLDCAP